MKPPEGLFRGRPIAFATIEETDPNYGIYAEGKLIAALAEVMDLARRTEVRDQIRCRVMCSRAPGLESKPEEVAAFLADRAEARELENRLVARCARRWEAMRPKRVGYLVVQLAMDPEAAEIRHDLDAAKEMAVLRNRILFALRSTPPWEPLAPAMAALFHEADEFWSRSKEERKKLGGGNLRPAPPPDDADIPF